MWSQECHNNDNKPDDVRTMEELSNLACSIFKCLNFTWDCPSKNANKMMPVLDAQLWLETETREVSIPEFIDKEAPKIVKQESLKVIIKYQFYKKSMASKTNNLFRGGIPLGSKIATGTQEVIRRLKNTSREIDHNTVKDIIMEYMRELREGGYPKNIREEILNSGFKGYARMWMSEVNNQGFVNRPGKATKMKRRANK